MTQFPNIAPPEVNVTTEYPGANAETSIKAVVTPLERAINGVPGMKYMSSDAGNDGVSVIQVIFETGTDPDVAAVNVQNRVAAVTGELPSEVIKNGVKIAKEENSMLMYINIFSRDDAVEEKFLYNFADINVLAEVKRVPGVGYADIVGAREYAMRIWLKPDRLVAYQISPQEVLGALAAHNLEAAPGKVGESSGRDAKTFQYVLKYSGKYSNKDEYEAIPVKNEGSGRIVRVKDIAEVEFSTAYYDVISKYNGRPTAAIMLKQLPGSNASKVIADVKDTLERLKRTTFLPDMEYEVSYDISRFLEASIAQVRGTLIEAFFLVALVVFIFLKDVRATLIPAFAVPVSLIGAFAFIFMMGFSINLITLLAIVLAIGIVVDNAIVVVEAVHTKLEKGGQSPTSATAAAMKEIAGAIVSITLIMSAVFIPVAFLSGPVGIFYRQFSVTMTSAIVLSGVVALTLTPALCAILLKNSHPQQKSTSVGRALARVDRWYEALLRVYSACLPRLASSAKATLGILALSLLLLIGFFTSLKSGFIPNEDQGTFYVSVTTPSGATLERTEIILNEVASIAEQLEGVQSVSSLAGTNILSDGTGATYGTLLVNLRPWSERSDSLDSIQASLEERISHIKGAKVEVFPPPAVPGYGNSSGFELRLLDKTGKSDLRNMEEVNNRFIAELRTQPEIGSAFSVFDASFPQFMIDVDPDRAAQKKLSVEDIMSTLQTFIGGEYATNFIKFGQMYKVMVQALPSYRAIPEDVLRLFVKNQDGAMIPISDFARLKKVYGVEQATRYNMYLSSEINGEPQAGFSSGQAIEAITRVAQKTLPRGFDIAWAGISLDETLAGNQAVYVFLICIVFVYLLLTAQYESFLIPLAVILSLPSGALGALGALWLTGLENNIYAQIAVVMLVGLLGKNAVLIVEFAMQSERSGMAPLEAAIEGARLRLRPILMTSLAFVAGLVPLTVASGAGAIGNRTIGIACAGGMIVGTILGLMVTPGLYVIFASIARRGRASLRVERVA